MNDFFQKKRILKNIDLLSFAGFKYITLIDVFKEKTNIYLLKKRKKLGSHSKLQNNDGFEICYQESRNDDNIQKIKTAIEEILKKKKVRETLIIIGVNEFKLFTLTTSETPEEEESWVNENIDKLLPAGTSLKDFEFSYVKYYEDENRQDYAIVLVRLSLIQKFLEIGAINGGYLVAIYPLIFSTLNEISELHPNTLIIDFGGEKIQTLRISDTNKIQYEVNYFQNIKISNNNPTEEAEIDYNIIDELAEEWISKFEIDKKEICLILNSDDPSDSIITDLLNEFFIHKKLKFKTFLIKKSHYLILSAVKNFFNKPFQGINLLSQSVLDLARDKIEKKISLKYVLVNFLVVLTFLFFIFLSDTLLSNQLNEANENLLNLSDNIGEMESLKSENTLLKNNFQLYGELRNHLPRHSLILKMLSEVISYETVITEIKIDQEENQTSTVEINGITSDQDSMALFINRLETNNKISDVKLSFISEIDSKMQNSNSPLTKSNHYQFNLSLKYVLD